MLKDQDGQGSFVEALMGHAEERYRQDWLSKVNSLVDWKPIEKRLLRHYAKDEGRPAIHPLIMFKALLLAEWHTLSDRELSRSLEYRYDFRRFTGLPFETVAPDDTTFVVFRKRILGDWKRLMEMVTRQLSSAGYKVHEAISVDATLVEAHSKPKRRDDGESEGGDSDGSWRGFPVKKSEDDQGNEVISRRMALFGYKVNLAATVGTGFIADASVCKASEHETHHLMEFVRDETKVVYADKGYVGNRAEVQRQGIRDGIHEKASRGHPLTKKALARNSRITKKRRIVEGVFGSLKQWYAWRKTRFMGLARNQLAIALTAVAWNLKKWAVLELAQGRA